MANRLTQIAAQKAAERPGAEAYRFCWRKDGEWLSTTRAEFAAQVKVAARAFLALGVDELSRIAICSPNTPQILITELGAFCNRLACIPIYASSSQQQFDFIVDDSKAAIIFVGDRHQYPLAYDYWKRHKTTILKIVIFKNDGLELNTDDDISITWDDFVMLGMKNDDALDAELENRQQKGIPNDIATLIYTSGTTGEPKGVEITHANYDACMDMHLELLTKVTEDDLSMAFLPMSHILEKAWDFFCITKGVAIAVNYDPRVIQETIHDVHPNLMCCVPRFWEKVYIAAREKFNSFSKLKRILVNRALKIGKRRNLHYLRTGKKVPFLIEKEYRFWDKEIFSKLKHAVGIPNPNMFPTAGAPLSNRIVEFFKSMGIDIVIGYGLSETTATVSCFREQFYEIGTVGKPLDGVEVKISDNGEILVKGATVTPGYYNNEEANRKAFTDDGWFRTGDLGYLTPSGALVLTERKKDLFKTSNGKYIAPQQLESMLVESKYIDEVAVIGDGRKYVSALIVPNYPNLREWALKEGIEAVDTEELVKNPRVTAFVMQQIDKMQRGLAGYEQIKKIVLLPHHFSIMNGEVTNTMKVRRPIVEKRYEREISSMYSEH